MLLRIAIITLSLLIIAALAVGLFAGPGLMQNASFLQSKPRLTQVRAETAELRPLFETVKAPGHIEPRRQVNISAEVSARILQLPFQEGDEVRRGDVVVRLDDRDLSAALAAAEARHEGEKFRLQSEQARLEGSLANLNFARRQLERKQTLFDSGDISSRELDEALERVEDIEASIEAAKYNISVIESTMVGAMADIDRAREALSKTVISSPIDGIITALNTEEGEVAMVGTMNNPGTVIMTIADLERMLLKAEVSENDIAKVQMGQSARIWVTAYPDEVFSGSVTHIALTRSVAGDGSGHFLTEVELDLQGRMLRSGLTANVDIEVSEHQGVVIPSQCVLDIAVDDLAEEIRDHPLVDRRKTVAFIVYRIVDGRIQITPVQPGPSDLTHQLILRGVEAGDMVVTGPYKTLADGLRQGESVTGDWATPAEKTEAALAEHASDAEGEDGAITHSATHAAGPAAEGDPQEAEARP